MYMTDLTAWIWKILFKGKNLEIYNVGSEEEIRIKNDMERLLKSQKTLEDDYDEESLHMRQLLKTRLVDMDLSKNSFNFSNNGKHHGRNFSSTSPGRDPILLEADSTILLI